jgi:hypothetical protein
MGLETVVTKAARHVVDSTAICAIANPILAILETQGGTILNPLLNPINLHAQNLSDEVSINARIIATIATYAGIGSAISKGRDYSRRAFHVTSASSERSKGMHDTLFLAAFNGVTTPALYYASGARGVTEIASGAAVATIFGLVAGMPMGKAIDTYRNLTNLQQQATEPERTLLLEQTKKPLHKTVRYGIVAALTAASIALTGAIYHVTPDRELALTSEYIVSAENK